MKILCLFILLFLSYQSQLFAEQVKFFKRNNSDSIEFNYQWLDQKDELQSLNFEIAKTALFDRFRNFRSYKADYARKYVDQRIKKKLSKEPLPNVQLSFSGVDKNMKIEITGKKSADIENAYQTIATLENELMQNYLSENFYMQFVSHNNNSAIKPDHARFAYESVADFKPLKQLILEKASIQNIRKVTNYVLGFVQSIPYSTLESRVTSSGAGFNPPLKTLWENQGDCDSKVTLTAALFRSLMPRIKMMLVFIDNHALLALNIPAEEDEVTITVDGFNYVLAEPTGPAKMLVGELAENSEFAIRNGRYFAEPFFAKKE